MNKGITMWSEVRYSWLNLSFPFNDDELLQNKEFDYIFRVQNYALKLKPVTYVYFSFRFWAGKWYINRFIETAHIVFYIINLKWSYLSIGFGQTTASLSNHKSLPMIYICSHKEAHLCFGKNTQKNPVYIVCAEELENPDTLGSLSSMHNRTE